MFHDRQMQWCGKSKANVHLVRPGYTGVEELKSTQFEAIDTPRFEAAFMIDRDTAACFRDILHPPTNRGGRRISNFDRSADQHPDRSALFARPLGLIMHHGLVPDLGLGLHRLIVAQQVNLAALHTRQTKTVRRQCSARGVIKRHSEVLHCWSLVLPQNLETTLCRNA